LLGVVGEGVLVPGRPALGVLRAPHGRDLGHDGLRDGLGRSRRARARVVEHIGRVPQRLDPAHEVVAAGARIFIERIFDRCARRAALDIERFDEGPGPCFAGVVGFEQPEPLGELVASDLENCERRKLGHRGFDGIAAGVPVAAAGGVVQVLQG
jgi:hypothetical protein